MKWTPDQQKIIDARNGNLLVSAAAGSGKTAVLVERIITMISDPADPVDIDKLLVVTFTKAAASQMKEKIGRALERLLNEHPEHLHYQEQLAALSYANIQTIDSFCFRVVKEHFHVLGLDPSIRIGDAGEIGLLQEEALSEVMEEFYEKDPDFVTFSEAFAEDKRDERIEDYIKKVYEVSSSYPRPEEWTRKACEALDVQNEEDFMNRPFMREYLAEIGRMCEDIIRRIDRILNMLEEPDAPVYMRTMLLSDQNRMRQIGEATTWPVLHALAVGKFDTMARAKKSDVFDKEAADQIKKMRDAYKKEAAKLLSQFVVPIDTVLAQLKEEAPMLKALLAITDRFRECFLEKKLKKGILEFSDVEHFALQILCQGYDAAGNPVPSEIGQEMAENFREILIDEYQDSNFLQEAILHCVSRIPKGDYNIFMVGDVKQSIYSFRMARPDLFMDKYHTYATEEGAKCRKLLLKNNFRSRANVLYGINYLFQQIMEAELGGIDYGEEEALVPGRSFPDSPDDSVELLIGESREYDVPATGSGTDRSADTQGKATGRGTERDTDSKVAAVTGEVECGVDSKGTAVTSGADRGIGLKGKSAGSGNRSGEKGEAESRQKEVLDEELNDIGKMELEASLIAGRIQSLMGWKGEKAYQVTDEETGKLRDLRLGDIVILFRSPSSFSSVFWEILKKRQIEVRVQNENGYFDTPEIRLVLSVLRVADNPYQDIEVAAALRGFFGCMRERELAQMELVRRRLSHLRYLYQAVSLLSGLYKGTLKQEQKERLCNRLGIDLLLFGTEAEQSGTECNRDGLNDLEGEGNNRTELETMAAECSRDKLELVEALEQDVNAAEGMTEERSGDRLELEKTEGKDVDAPENMNGESEEVQPPILETEELRKLCEKCAAFVELISNIREQKQYQTVSGLLRDIYYNTGYYYYTAAMPGGTQRVRNLELLLSEADRFEAGGFRSLFHFLRYVERLMEKSISLGGDAMPAGGEDAVRIMSIHRSKGLEFPVVFVAGLGKRFNLTDTRTPLIIHSDYYVCAKYVNAKKRWGRDQITREAVASLMAAENLAEELRVFYVGLTRAKEKLILTGVTGDIPALVEKYQEVADWKKTKLPYGILRSTDSYLSLVVAALMRHPVFRKAMFQLPSRMDSAEEIVSAVFEQGFSLTDPSFRLKVQLFDYQNLVVEHLAGTAEQQLLKEQLLAQWRKQDRTGRAVLEERFAWRYNKEPFTTQRSKMSVTEIQRIFERRIREAEGQQELSAEEGRQKPSQKQPAPIPRFIGEERKMNAGERGTWMHKVMEMLDLSCLETKEQIREALKKLWEEERLPEETRDFISEDQIYTLVSSPLGKRMREAARRQMFYKEKQFVTGIPVSRLMETEAGNVQQVGTSTEAGEQQVVVQGIIDAYFREGDSLILLDYKTDKVREDEADVLTERYRVQLGYYRDTLEQLTGLKVAETYLYSFALGREIRIHART